MTPEAYLQVGGAVVTPMSYQLARSYSVPIEGLVLAVDALLLGAQQPWLLGGVLTGLAAALGAGAWQLVRRAGSVAALRMAWQGDWLRAADEWRRWT